MSLNKLNGYLRNTFLPLINSFNQSDGGIVSNELPQIS